MYRSIKSKVFAVYNGTFLLQKEKILFAGSIAGGGAWTTLPENRDFPKWSKTTFSPFQFEFFDQKSEETWKQNRPKIVEISGGRSHVIFRSKNGYLFGHGKSEYGALGKRNDYKWKDEPWRMNLIELNHPKLGKRRAKQVACGNLHSIFLSTDFFVFGCGYNSWGQLGYKYRNSASNVKDVVLLKSLVGKKVVQIDAGFSYSFFLCKNGDVFSCGFNEGRIGVGRNGTVFVPTKVVFSPGVKIVQAVAGSRHSIFLSQSGAVYVSGTNEEGNLGLEKSLIENNSSTYGYRYFRQRYLQPKEVKFLRSKEIVKISSIGFHTLFLSSTCRVYGVGNNNYHQLVEENDELKFSNKGKIGEIRDLGINEMVQDIVTGEYHTVLVLKDGRIMTGGSNLNCQCSLENDILNYMASRKTDKAKKISVVKGIRLMLDSELEELQKNLLQKKDNLSFTDLVILT